MSFRRDNILSTARVDIPLLQFGKENKNKTVISEKLIRDNLLEYQFNYLKRMCWTNNNSVYGLYPRGAGHRSIYPMTIDTWWYQSGVLFNEIVGTVKDGKLDFDALYESILFKNKRCNLYKIFLVDTINDYPIYFLGDYSHLKYHINFRDLRVGVSSDFKYRSSKSRIERRRLVQK